MFALSMFIASNDIEARYESAERHMAKARSLHVVAMDKRPGDAKEGVRYDCWYADPGKYRVTWPGGGEVSDTHKKWAYTPGFGWYDDFPPNGGVPEEWRWVGFTSFFSGEPALWEIFGVNGDRLEFKTTESAIFYGKLWWSVKKMVPAGYDFYEQAEFAHSIRYELVEVGAKPPKGCFEPRSL